MPYSSTPGPQTAGGRVMAGLMFIALGVGLYFLLNAQASAGNLGTASVLSQRGVTVTGTVGDCLGRYCSVGYTYQGAAHTTSVSSSSGLQNGAELPVLVDPQNPATAEPAAYVTPDGGSGAYQTMRLAWICLIGFGAIGLGSVAWGLLAPPGG